MALQRSRLQLGRSKDKSVDVQSLDPLSMFALMGQERAAPERELRPDVLPDPAQPLGPPATQEELSMYDNLGERGRRYSLGEEDRGMSRNGAQLSGGGEMDRRSSAAEGALAGEGEQPAQSNSAGDRTPTGTPTLTPTKPPRTSPPQSLIDLEDSDPDDSLVRRPTEPSGQVSPQVGEDWEEVDDWDRPRVEDSSAKLGRGASDATSRSSRGPSDTDGARDERLDGVGGGRRRQDTTAGTTFYVVNTRADENGPRTAPVVSSMDDGIAPPSVTDLGRDAALTSTASASEGQGPGRTFVKDGFRSLTGEQMVMNLMNTSLQVPSGIFVKGELLMTTYRIIFIPMGVQDPTQYRSGHNPYHNFAHLSREFCRIPLACIDRIDKYDNPRDRAPGVIIHIVTKDLRQWRLMMDRVEHTEKAFEALVNCAFPGNTDHVFAFTHTLWQRPVRDPGWDKHLSEQDFQRMGVMDQRRDGSPSPWRLSGANGGCQLCQSYPQSLVVPKQVHERDLAAVAAFRSECRIPALTWGRARDNASLWRCSQPKIGVAGASCLEDEKLLDLLARLTPPNAQGQQVLYISDCRPKTNAMANMAAGYGYETASGYPNCRVDFLNIGNIHVMRDSLNKLMELSLSPGLETNWGAMVEDTKWLSHVRTVISAAYMAAHTAHTRGAPVLVHCSHGWDRTSQVCALAQIFLDPYYRTITGLQMLIQKDWLDFGHPFQLRHQHGTDRSRKEYKRDKDNYSPIFLQFLDCLWQLCRQFPSAFEYNSRYLLCIADHAYSCRFGTLLGSSWCERMVASLHSYTPSLWTYLELNRESFRSPFYIPPGGTADKQERDQWGHLTNHSVLHAAAVGDGALLPQLSVVLRRVTLWSDFYLRWSPRPSGGRTAEAVSAAIFAATPQLDQRRVGHDARPPMPGPCGLQCSTQHAHWTADLWEHPEYKEEPYRMAAIQDTMNRAVWAEDAHLERVACESDEMEDYLVLAARRAEAEAHRGQVAQAQPELSQPPNGEPTPQITEQQAAPPDAQSKAEQLLEMAREEIARLTEQTRLQEESILALQAEVAERACKLEAYEAERAGRLDSVRSDTRQERLTDLLLRDPDPDDMIRDMVFHTAVAPGLSFYPRMSFSNLASDLVEASPPESPQLNLRPFSGQGAAMFDSTLGEAPTEG